MGGEHHVELNQGWRLWRAAVLRAPGMPFSWLAPFAAQDDPHEAARSVLARDPFLAALTWQNPAMVEQWVGRYAAAVAAGVQPRISRGAGWKLAKVANYAQRYCAKNDTIGFFGPVSWATLDDHTDATERTGSGSIVEHTVYFEVWAMEHLAARWAADERLLPYLRVRLHPTISVTDAELRRPLQSPMPLSEPVAALLAAIDGRRRFADVVDLAARAVHGEVDLAGELVRLRDADVVLIDLPVPIDEWPERALAAHVSEIPDDDLRTELLGQLDRLESARQRLDQVARQPVPLVNALRDVRDTFESLTSSLPDRKGEYGRLPVYLDSRTDRHVTIGTEALDRLRLPLGLLLDSARWFVDQIAGELDGELRRIFQTLRARGTSGVVSLAELQVAALDLFTGAPGTKVHQVAEDFRLRWAEVIPSEADHEVRLRGADIAPVVTALFPPGELGWASARYQSPDLMLGYLDGADAAPVWVLGELHMAMNTLESRVFHTQALDRAALGSAAAEDLSGGRILPVHPTWLPRVTSRTCPPSAVHLDEFAYWSYTADGGHPQGTPVLRAAELTVTMDGGDLLVGADGQSWRATAMEFLGDLASVLVVNHFQVRTPRRHLPRVRIDDLVVCRESWRLPASEVASADAGLRRYLTDLGVPRHAFYKTVAERKPSYVDLDAPLHMRNLSAAAHRVLRSAGEKSWVDIVEMLPDPHQLWLTDASGERYTSEFRVVAVDDRDRRPVFRAAEGDGREVRP